MRDEDKNQVGNIIIGCDELRDLNQCLNCPSCEAQYKKVLGKTKKEDQKGKYFSVDKLLR